MEVALISGFCSVKRMRLFDSPSTGHWDDEVPNDEDYGP